MIRFGDIWTSGSIKPFSMPLILAWIVMSVAKSNTAQIPWTRYNSSFTLLFDRWVMQLVKEMPVKPASRIVREHDTRLWRIVHHHVDQALEKHDLSQVRHIAVDETSAKRGHHYVTVVLDSDTHHVVFATKGKDQQTMVNFADHLSTH